MKLFRHGPPGAERAGAVDADGTLRDLSLLVPDLTPDWLAPPKLAAIAAIDLPRMPAVSPGTRLGPPVAGVRQILGIGLNYRLHAAECNSPIPAEPLVFSKSLGCIAGPNDELAWPEGAQALDHEVELGVVIGRAARRVAVDEALSYVAGYCLANDVSERDWQIHRTGQWIKGKSHDGFGPLGPWLVTTDELPDPQAVELSLHVNGERRQHSSTADMIFTVAQIVSHLSGFMTLAAGDVIVTGTPAGVAMGRQPPRWLARGDVITLHSPQLGSQVQRVV